MKPIRGEYFIELHDGNNIFYCHTHEVINFFKNPPKNKFILITHNSDGNITNNPKKYNAGSSNDVDFNQLILPNNLIKWYGQNVDVIHDRITSIPIGLENSMWFKEIGKEEKILKKRKEEKNYTNLMYVCHNIRTNPIERTEPYQLFNNTNWSTIEHGTNGYNFENYLNKIHSHKFVLCPDGNGIDTHRVWETLYVGSIPIQKRNINNKFYENLPICYVNNWVDINEEFLKKEYEKIINTDWNLEKLDFNYWENKIKNEIKNL